MGKTIKLTESKLRDLIQTIISEQMTQTLGSAARGVAATQGMIKNVDQINPKIIEWLKANKVYKGHYNTSLKYPKMIDIKYFPPSTLGASRERVISAIYPPSYVTKSKGTWTFDGTKINFQ